MKNIEYKNSIAQQKEEENLDTSRSREVVLRRLEKLGVKPHENIGQHFLVNDKAIENLAQTVTPGNTVIEVGPGIGQLTEALAGRAVKVTAIEIDQRFSPVLDDVAKEHPNIEIIYSDVLKVKLEKYIPRAKSDYDSKVQIVANLPYHISEPFLHKICGLPLESIILVVGDNLANSMLARGENNYGFGQLSLLSQVFFHIDIMSWLEKKDFFPPPRTKSAIVKLLPKEEFEFLESQHDFLLRRLFLSSSRMPLVKNALKEGLIEFKRVSSIGTNGKMEFNRQHRRGVRQELRQDLKYYEYASEEPVSKEDRMTLTQNEARRLIQKMGIPDDILNKPFQQLNNTEIQTLSAALRYIEKI